MASNAHVTKTDLLEPVSTVVIPATSAPFVARDTFVVNTRRNAPVKITYLGGNFREWFLGTTEGPIAETTLRYHRLRKSSLDKPIIVELGGEEKSETTLTEIFSLMAGQKNGEAGALLNDGNVNIFYVRDANSVLRAVFVRWLGDGWLVGAGSVESPHRWHVGYLVFSRLPAQASKSVLRPSAAA